MLDPSMLLYLLAVAGVLAIDVGLVGLLSSDDDAEDEDAGEDTAERISPIDFGEGPDDEPDAYRGRADDSAGDDSELAEAFQADMAFFLAQGDDFPFAPSGNDFADGRHGDDTLDLGDGDDIASGGAGDDTLVGGAGDDELWGQDGADLIDGAGGDDVIYGGAGDDIIDGGAGGDEIFGGDGDDWIGLGDGDTATGGTGADTFAVYEVAAADAPAANVTDFDAAEDKLEIEYVAQLDPETGAALDPELTVSYDPDADLTSVSIFGAEVATLDGDAGITEDDVTLVEIS